MDYMKKRLIALLLALCILIGTGVISAPALAESIKVYVAVNTLPVYNRVSGSTVTLGTMSFGEEMTCVAVNGSWACVKNASGAVGYCKTEGLTNINPNKYNTTVYAKAAGVKVYKKPDTSSSVLKVLALNDSYTGVAITPDSKWIRMKNGSTYGYALASQMGTTANAEHGALIAETVYVISNTLPVYASASASSRKMGTMAYGETMKRVDVSDGWAKVVNDKGEVGYCAADGVLTENPNVLNLTVYAADNGVKIYKKPDTSSGVMKTCVEDEKFVAVSITLDGVWLRLKNGTSYGYIKAEDVTAGSTDPDPDPVSGTVYVYANTLPVYASASTSSRKLGTMAFGESMVLLDLSETWAKVRNSSGEVGYCQSGGLTATNPNILGATVYIAADGVKIYNKPSTSYKVLKTAKQNESYTAVAITMDGLWMRVSNGSGYGYVESENVSDVKIEDSTGSTVYVISNTLPVYQAANISSKLLGTMAYGESMVLMDESGSWAKVMNSSGAVGYCSKAGLGIENPNNINKTGYASASGVKVYKKPSTSSGTIASLSKNAEVMVVAITQDNKWMRISSGSGYGYVLAEYISDSQGGEINPTTVYVSDNTLKVYQSESESAKVLGTMSYGESMTLLNVDDGWAQVRNASGAVGYCLYGGLTDSNPNNKNETMYAQSKISLYKKPLTSSGVAKSVTQNTALTVVAVTKDNAWARVIIGSGSYAYAQMDGLADTKVGEGEVPDAGGEENGEEFVARTIYGVATSTTCYASASTSAKSVGSLYFGQSATCTAVSGDWAQIKNSSGTVAYCKLSNISTENPNKYSVSVYAKSAGTKVYSKPSTSSSVIATVSKNGKCTAVAVSTDNKWYRLKNGSTYGYVLASDFSTTASGGDSGGNDSGNSSKIQKVISIAEAQYGKKYVYGAEGPTYFDCSGLIYYAFKNGAGITLPRTAEKMGYSNTYPKISSISDLKVGDLVFFNTSSDSDECDHVGIYLGSGYFVHASSAAAKVVKSSLSSGYYNRVFSWGRRVL